MRDQLTEDRIRETYAETIDALYGYVSRRCNGDRALAEDVTQEAWLRAIREWPRTGMPRTPLAWLKVVARNLILNVLRRRGGVPLDDVTPAQLLAALDDGPVAESSDTATLVMHAMDRLPEQQARLLEAFHFKHVKVAQIARAFGMSERAVEGRLRRARQQLRREIEAVLKTQGGLA